MYPTTIGNIISAIPVTSEPQPDRCGSNTGDVLCILRRPVENTTTYTRYVCDTYIVPVKEFTRVAYILQAAIDSPCECAQITPKHGPSEVLCVHSLVRAVFTIWDAYRMLSQITRRAEAPAMTPNTFLYTHLPRCQHHSKRPLVIVGALIGDANTPCGSPARAQQQQPPLTIQDAACVHIVKSAEYKTRKREYDDAYAAKRQRVYPSTSSV